MPDTSLPGNRVELLHDGAACLPAMLGAIAAAQREILLEMYWFGSDRTGRRFAEALAERARAGIRVCVTYDAFGSFEADRAMFQGLRDAGCGVYEYNPVRLFRSRTTLAGLNRRNHRKLLIVDGEVGFTGGMNLGDPWAPGVDGGAGFRDDMVRVEGPAVRAMRDIMLAAYRGPHREQALGADLGSDEPRGPCRVRVVANALRGDRRVIERAYMERIRVARSRVLITNSYFVPGRLLRRALTAAAQRVVTVRVLVPGLSDVPMMTYVMHRLYGSLLRRGVELYEWGGGILHAKTAVIDGEWCTIGTHNLDRRSWAYNLEVNVIVEDEALARDFETTHQRDLQGALRIDAREFRYRPLGARLLELFFYYFHRLL